MWWTRCLRNNSIGGGRQLVAWRQCCLGMLDKRSISISEDAIRSTIEETSHNWGGMSGG